jgi:multidrug efflux pump subunit AcrA (membrane-fusion protein)
MKNFFVTAIFLSIFLFSCTQNKTTMVTMDLSRTDYREVIEAPGTIKAVNSVTIMPPRDSYGGITVDWVKPEGSQVEPGDTICIMKSDESMQMLDEQVRNLETLKADYTKLEADNALNQAMLDARVKENLAGMAINQLDSVQMRFAPPIKKRLMALELEKAHVQERKLQKKFLSEKAIDETEIRQLKSRIMQAENMVQMMQEKTKELVILAPSSGILSASEQTGRIMVSFGPADEPIEIGGYPKPGTAMIFSEVPLMAIPDLTEMQIKAEVPEVDYKRIEKGQKVTIMVDAVKGLQTTGTVKMKPMAPKIKYISEQVQYKYYEIIVGVDSCHTRMPPGLSARCNILINEVKDTVVVPTIAIFERDSMKVVYVADGENFFSAKVETGLTNSSQTIITKGLVGKETIALAEPPQKYIKKPKKTTHE